MVLTRITVTALWVALASLVLPARASAALGGDMSSIDADRVRMQGALLRIVNSDAYSLHEVQSSSGTTVREYVSSTGRVFAVAWQGPWLPDMRQILGTYFGEYQRVQAAPRNRRARGSLVIDQSDLVVQMSGHPRAFSGRAYVPNLLPQRVQLDAIR